MILFNFLCANMLSCADWFFTLCKVLLAFTIPYTSFRFFDIVNIWPGRWLTTVYNSVWANMLVGLSGAFYSILLLYAIAFMFLDLQLLDVIDYFYKLFFSAIFSMDIWYQYIIAFYDYFANEVFWNILEKTGLQEILERYGILEKLGIGTIETPGVEIESLEDLEKDSVEMDDEETQEKK